LCCSLFTKSPIFVAFAKETWCFTKHTKNGCSAKSRPHNMSLYRAAVRVLHCRLCVAVDQCKGPTICRYHNMSLSFQKELYAYRLHLRTELTIVQFICIIHTHNFEVSLLYWFQYCTWLSINITSESIERYSHVDIWLLILMVVFESNRQSSNLIKDTYYLLSIFLGMYS